MCMGLGPLHSVTLAQARDKALEARQLILDGKDPIELKRQAMQQQKIEQLKVMTFREAALDFLQTSKIETLKNDKHRKQWRSTLEQYAFPVIGDLPLQSIDTAIVLKALLPVWKRTPETGSRLRGRIERVIDWAKPLGLFTGENPARQDLLKDHLPARQKVEHHKAMPYADVPAFVQELRDRRSMSARALEFTILTAVRTSEAIGAMWSEIDLDAATWIIPASRMKAKRDHRVALSHRAVELLRAVERKGERVFPLQQYGDAPRAARHGRQWLHGAWFPLCLQRLGAGSHWLCARPDRDGVGPYHQGQERSGLQARRCARQAAQADGRVVRYLEAPAAVGDNVTALRSA